MLVVGWCLGHGDKTTLSSLASKHKAPMGPHRTSNSEFRSQCCDDKRYHLCHCVFTCLSSTFNNCCHGYLAARPTARSYAHGSTLQFLPSGVVCTAASADIVQLQQAQMGHVSLSWLSMSSTDTVCGVCVCYLAWQCRSVLGDVKFWINCCQVPVEVPTSQIPFEPQTLCDVRALRLYKRNNSYFLHYFLFSHLLPSQANLYTPA